MKTEIKMAHAVELYETLLHQAIEDQLTAAALGDTAMSFQYTVNQMMLVRKLEAIIGKAKTGRMFAQSYSGFMCEVKDD